MTWDKHTFTCVAIKMERNVSQGMLSGLPIRKIDWFKIIV